MFEVNPDLLKVIAKSKGIDIEKIKGSGPNGKPTSGEIERAVLWGAGQVDAGKS